MPDLISGRLFHNKSPKRRDHPPDLRHSEGKRRPQGRIAPACSFRTRASFRSGSTRAPTLIFLSHRARSKLCPTFIGFFDHRRGDTLASVGLSSPATSASGVGSYAQRVFGAHDESR
jgi:hypothetical protein